jgi:transposase-like protein
MPAGWFPKLEKAFWKQQALYGSVYKATLCYCLQMLEQSRRNKRAALNLMRNLLKKYGFVPDKLVTDELRSYAAAAHDLGIAKRHQRPRSPL